MKFTKYQKQLAFLIKMAKDAEKIIKSNHAKVYDKGKGDLVTSCDYKIEKHVIAQIQKYFPDTEVISEEYNPKPKLSKKNTFMIDPVDGTVNFANAWEMWGTQLAYAENGETVASVIYQPYFKKMYCAIKGEGAYLNGKRITVSDKDPMHSTVNLGSLGIDPRTYEITSRIKREVQCLRIIGCGSACFGYLAAGNFGGCVFFQTTVWDMEPGILIAKEAGAVCQYDAKKDYLVVTNTQELCDIITSIINS